ncbi:MAG: hypothetical protein IJZ51_11320 [Ruminiclostridium sp.]|nr:hypothetical protein [Ruminiclostridium sp.]
MGYTTFSPVDDRFGFKTNGTFKTAYDSERVVILAIFGVIIFFLVSAVICFILGFQMIFTPPDMNKTALEGEKGNRVIFGFNTAEYGLLIISMIIFFIMAILSTAALLVAFAILKSGKNCFYKADEIRMEIIQQGRRRKVSVINYADVTKVDYRDRKFLFLGGFDVFVHTNKKTYEFRFIHNRLSKVVGISETPFNIILERTGAVKRPEY